MKVIRKCKNGSFLVQKDGLDSERENSLVFELCNSAELDFQVAGDMGCASNYGMYYPLYNANTDLIYYLLGKDCEIYANGKAVWLFGRILNDDEREELEQMMRC